MKALIVSDSHGARENLEEAVRQTMPDCVYHMGDHIGDADDLRRVFPQIPIYAVCGNCDRLTPGPLLVLDELGGVRLMGCHGHQYGVKSGLTRLRYAAMEQNVQLCLYGHTHVPFCEAVGGITFLNPGACSGAVPTYAVVEAEHGALHCRLHRLNANKSK